MDRTGGKRDKEREDIMGTNERAPKKRFDENFKKSAVELLAGSGKSVSQIARELGVSIWNLRDWREIYQPRPARSLAEVEAENLVLRGELQRVKNQRDILKKTLGILSAPPDNGLSA